MISIHYKQSKIGVSLKCKLMNGKVLCYKKFFSPCAQRMTLKRQQEDGGLSVASTARGTPNPPPCWPSFQPPELKTKYILLLSLQVHGIFLWDKNTNPYTKLPFLYHKIYPLQLHRSWCFISL